VAVFVEGLMRSEGCDGQLTTKAYKKIGVPEGGGYVISYQVD